MRDDRQLQKNQSFFMDLARFLIANKKWWLIPIAIALLLIGVLVILGGTSVAPFIYSLF